MTEVVYSIPVYWKGAYELIQEEFAAVKIALLSGKIFKGAEKSVNSIKEGGTGRKNELGKITYHRIFDVF